MWRNWKTVFQVDLKSPRKGGGRGSAEETDQLLIINKEGKKKGVDAAAKSRRGEPDTRQWTSHRSGQSSPAGSSFQIECFRHCVDYFTSSPNSPRGRCLYYPHLQTRNLNKTRLGHLPKVTSHWGFEPQQLEFKPVGNDLEAALGNGEGLQCWTRHSFYSGGLLQRRSSISSTWVFREKGSVWAKAKKKQEFSPRRMEQDYYAKGCRLHEGMVWEGRE